MAVEGTNPQPQKDFIVGWWTSTQQLPSKFLVKLSGAAVSKAIRFARVAGSSNSLDASVERCQMVSVCSAFLSKKDIFAQIIPN